MITIDQLLESVDLDFKPKFVTKDEDGCITIWDEHKPVYDNNIWGWNTFGVCDYIFFDRLKLSEFDGKHWKECIYEVPRKTTGKIEKLDVGYKDSLKIKDWQDVARTVENKINQIVDYVDALIESNNIHEKQIDELQMKLEPEKCAVNELKGAKNE